MPSALPLFPVTTVGSWPRPASLIRALKSKNRGELSQEEFETVADGAVLDVLHVQEEAGVDVVTDGEQRRDNFYSFLADRLDGGRLMTKSELIDYAEDKADFHRTTRPLDAPAVLINSPNAVDRPPLRGALAAHADLLAAGWPGVRDPDPLWLKPHLARLRHKLTAVGAPMTKSSKPSLLTSPTSLTLKPAAPLTCDAPRSTPRGARRSRGEREAPLARNSR